MTLAGMTVDVGAGLDALVAEKVFGVTERAPRLWRGNYFYASPSTTWEGAGLVVERMRELGWPVMAMTTQDSHTHVEFFQPSYQVDSFGTTAPEAICRAALRAVAAIEAGGEDD